MLHLFKALVRISIEQWGFDSSLSHFKSTTSCAFAVGLYLLFLGSKVISSLKIIIIISKKKIFHLVSDSEKFKFILVLHQASRICGVHVNLLKNHIFMNKIMLQYSHTGIWNMYVYSIIITTI